MAELLPPAGYLGPGGFVQTSGGGGAPPMFEVSADAGRATTLNAVGPEILYEWACNLSTLVGSPIHIEAEAVIRSLYGAQATFTVFIGSTTPGDTTGGTAVFALTTSSTTDVLAAAVGPSIANPGVDCLLQITGVSAALCSLDAAYIRGVFVRVRT